MAMYFGCVALPLIGFFLIPLLFKGCAIFVAGLVLIPLLIPLDRWRRRQRAAESLRQGSPMVWRKIRIALPEEGKKIFQSYWSGPESDRELELDHPIEMFAQVEQASEWWMWTMPQPLEDGGTKLGVRWAPVRHDIGLVAVDEDGRRRLIIGGPAYFPWDPWGRRLETGGYEE